MKQNLVLFKALSNQTRYRIIELLLQKELCVYEIYPRVNRTQSAVSIQLGKLEDWRIVKSRRDGKKIFYRIANNAVYDIFRALGKKRGRSHKTSPRGKDGK